MQISIYKNSRDTQGSTTTLQAVIEMIQSDAAICNAISALRLTDNQDTKDKLKKNLPAVTFSGTFYKRKASEIAVYNSLLTIDIDKLTQEEVNKLLPLIKQNSYTHIAFISPSGCGIKVIIKTAAKEPKTHTKAFLFAATYYKEFFNVEIDQSGKDVSRLCFLSYDENIFYNPNSEVFGTIEMFTETKLSKTEVFKSISLDDIKAFTDKKYTYQVGSRNIYIYTYACNCNRAGINVEDCFDYATANFDLDTKEIQHCVKGAYERNSKEFGKFKPDEKATKKTDNKKKNFNNEYNNEEDWQDPDISHIAFTRFWTVSQKRDNDGEVIPQTTTYRVHYKRLTIFLYENGFCKLRQGNTYELVHMHHKRCTPVTEQQVIDFMDKWCEENKQYNIHNVLIRGSKNYFGRNVLNHLPYSEIHFKKDTKDKKFLYFQNVFVCITKDAITTHDYKELDGVIWERNIIKHDFTVQQATYFKNEDKTLDHTTTKCVFARFISYCSHNPEENKAADIIIKRLFAHMSSIGYLLHTHKEHPSKSIISTDYKKSSDKYEQNGGTGKSLCGKSLEYVTKTSLISGKSYDPKDRFKFQNITIDSSIIFFNDVRNNFPLESIFELIEDDLIIERKQQGVVVVKFEDLGKTLLTTNYIIRGEGNSFERRMHVIEYSDFFTPQRTPATVFEHQFFKEWNLEQWNLFYNFMAECVQLYLNEGLVTYAEGNYLSRRLTDTVVPEFLNWIESEQNFERNKPRLRLELFQAYKAIHTEYYAEKFSPNKFSSWVKQYCKVQGLKFNPLQKGQADKRHGAEYFTIADDGWDKVKHLYS